MGSPVLLGLRQLALDHWEKLFVKPCPLCRRSLGSPGAPGAICQGCRKHLDLPTDGFQGLDPLPWWGAGPYRAGLRGLVLDLKRQPCRQSVAALVATMTPSLRCQGEGPLLVPIPSWKRPGNPLPPLVCQELVHQLGLERRDLLERTRPVLGQHHLGRRLRLANQEGAFSCRARFRRRSPRTLLLVDDVLTTGSTALSAGTALEAGGWHVLGLICLARTPARRERSQGLRTSCDLRSHGRVSDRPG
jgi:predicted amidophosphoribosyltransferase